MSAAKIEIEYFKTKIGEMLVGSFENQLCLLDFRYRKMRQQVDNRLQKGLNSAFIHQDNLLLQEARNQLQAYLEGTLQQFDLPIRLVGTDFQQAVWKALMEIPYGTTASYSDLAEKIQNKDAVRAVALANGANALAIIVPCHRIIGKNGELVGYGGGLVAKKRLLKLENNRFGSEQQGQLF